MYKNKTNKEKTAHSSPLLKRRNFNCTWKTLREWSSKIYVDTKSVLIFSVIALYLGPAKGKRRQDKDHHKIGLNNGTLRKNANLTLPPLMALEDISFAPATDWKGSMGLGVAYRFYRAKAPTVG